MKKQPLTQSERVSPDGVEITEFVATLATEGERVAVIISAARIDFVLESLLKGLMVPNTAASDPLFDSDRPLGTFSAKIALAYIRCGLSTSLTLLIVNVWMNSSRISRMRLSTTRSIHYSRGASVPNTFARSAPALRWFSRLCAYWKKFLLGPQDPGQFYCSPREVYSRSVAIYQNPHRSSNPYEGCQVWRARCG